MLNYASCEVIIVRKLEYIFLRIRIKFPGQFQRSSARIFGRHARSPTKRGAWGNALTRIIRFSSISPRMPIQIGNGGPWPRHAHCPCRMAAGRSFRKCPPSLLFVLWPSFMSKSAEKEPWLFLPWHFIRSCNSRKLGTVDKLIMRFVTDILCNSSFHRTHSSIY